MRGERGRIIKARREAREAKKKGIESRKPLNAHEFVRNGVRDEDGYFYTRSQRYRVSSIEIKSTNIYTHTHTHTHARATQVSSRSNIPLIKASCYESRQKEERSLYTIATHRKCSVEWDYGSVDSVTIFHC